MQNYWLSTLDKVIPKKYGRLVKRSSRLCFKGVNITVQLYLVYEAFSVIFGYPAKVNGASMSPTLNAEEPEDQCDNLKRRNHERRIAIRSTHESPFRQLKS